MPSNLFASSRARHAQELPAGDVKYHQGFSSDVSTPGGPVHLTLAFNPSHLEIVNPVVEGSVRARQHRRGDTTRRPGAAGADPRRRRDRRARASCRNASNMAADARLLHGRHDPHRHQQPDRLHHVRSARHARHARTAPTSRRWSRRRSCTSTATIPEVALLAVEIALDYRQRFHKDVFIDLVCFRTPRPQRGRRADGDAAADVQAASRSIPGTRKLYAEQLVGGRRDRRPSEADSDDRDVPRRDGQGPAHQQDGAVELQAAVRDRLGAVTSAGTGPTSSTPRVPLEKLKALSAAPDDGARRTSSFIRASRR